MGTIMDSAENIGKNIGDETLAKFQQSLSAVEKRIYFRVVEDAPGCPKDKPYGVIGEKSGVVHGCHSSRASANKQLSGLYAATDPKNGYKPGKEDKKNLESPTQHEKRRAKEKKAEEKKKSMSGMEDGIHPLNPRQQAQYEALETVVELFGKYDQSTGANGAHYAPAEKNPFQAEGLVCGNCAFFEGPRACELVDGDIDPMAVCKLWIIPEDIL